MDLTTDFKEFVELLNKHEVRYLVVGGYAVAVYGHPRYTKDLDIWIEASNKNSDRILVALNEFGFGSLDLNRDDFLEPGWIVQLGNPPNRIDLLTSVSGLQFAESYEARNIVLTAGQQVSFVSLSDLIRSKVAAGRPQDLADVDHLRNERGEN